MTQRKQRGVGPPTIWVRCTEQDAHLPEYEHRRVSRVGNPPGEALVLEGRKVTAEALAGMSDAQLALATNAMEMMREIEERGSSSIGLDFQAAAG